ncbi:hypothetical protein ABZ851_30765 [Streptomyces sp. NPDC047049]|uniref:hypothetical protein n=1 Tax=Streptomyces sp. NPDC047049 TaxID=3156688 RepID=UPI0033E50901
MTFLSLATWTARADMPVSAYTLRQALNGSSPPSRRTVLAFLGGARAAAHARAATDEEAAARLQRMPGEQALVRLQEAAVAAVRRPPPAGRPVPYLPGRVTTGAGLARAMRCMRTAAGEPTLDELTARGGGRFSRSALHNALTGRRLPGEQLLAGFAEACGAGEDAAGALLAARRRILAGPRPPAVYPCDIAERAEERRQQDEAARPWLTGPERDWYDQQLHDEEEAAHRRMTAWVDALTDDELQELAQSAAGTGRNLRAELAAYTAHTRPDTETDR